MAKFKKGDTVERVGSSFKDVKNGELYIVRGYKSSDSVLLEGLSEFGYDTANFKLVIEKSKIRKAGDTSTEWNFVIHNVCQINTEEIRECLTPDNPVALVEVKNGKDNYAFATYHHSILIKAEAFKISPPTVKTVKDFGRAVTFVKTVLQKAWKSPEQVVTVRLPQL